MTDLIEITEDGDVGRRRWAVVAWYLTEGGLIDVHHDLTELSELHDIIERGPSWQAIEKIEIIYRGLPEKLTVEETERL